MTRKLVTIDHATKALPAYVIAGSDLLTTTAAPALIEGVVAPMLTGIGPVASWTQTGNKTAAVSAVDVDTDTLTSAGHTLAVGDIVIPYMNDGVSAALRQYLPGGMILGGYYVINVTPNTFQLSSTSGGAPLGLTVRATMDVTKWHFETKGAAFIGFSGLSGRRFRFVVKGQFLLDDSGTYWMRPNANQSTSFCTSATMAANGTGGGGPCWGRAQADIVFDARSMPSVVGLWASQGQLAATADATLVTKTVTDNLMVALPPQDITSLKVEPYATHGIYWANGSVMEVYAQ